jgi:DNA-binding LacI/PurR family transcriptional regulator
VVGDFLKNHTQREMGFFAAGVIKASEKSQHLDWVSVVDGPFLIRNAGEVGYFFPNLCGIFVFRDPTLCRTVVEHFSPRGVPVFNYGSSLYAGDCGTPFYLEVHEDEVVRKGLEYLWKKGHRKIGVVHNNGDVHHERARVWKEWMSVRGEPVEDAMRFVLNTANPHPEYENDPAFKTLASKVTALFATEDSSVSPLMHGLRQLGFSLPTDISLLGVNNSLVAQNSFPRLTSINLPLFDHGKYSFELLSQVVSGKIQQIGGSASVEVIERESVQTI